MLFETDMTTQDVLKMYAIWFAFIIALLTFLLRKNSK